MRRIYWYLLSAILYSLLTPSTGFACSCGDDASPEKTMAQRILQSKDKAKVVFSGKVVAQETIRATKTLSGNPTEVELFVVRFKVERWWKGNNTDEVILYTNKFRTFDGYEKIFSCDYSFKEGERYLVYAYEFEEQLHTDICTRTKLLEKAEDDLKELGEDGLAGSGEA
jgi:hypothetical protein